MLVRERYFLLNNQWNIIHLPEQPSGFGVLIIGDLNHFVEEKTTSWLQHPERCLLIEQLLEDGYTVFYSNLFGRNWGSNKSIYHILRLYSYVMKKEILNPKIHLICEGMGALAGLKWAEDWEDHIRSIALMNPCIDLKYHVQQEKEKKLFYKRLLYELSEAYECEIKEIEKNIDLRAFSIGELHSKLPTKIWHVTQGTPFPITHHSRKYEEHRRSNGFPIELSLQIPRNPHNPYSELKKFFKQHEKVL